MVRSRAGGDRSATAILWSGRWIVLGTVCAFGAAALLMSALLPDRYKARIRLDPRPEIVASAQVLATDAVLPGRTGLSRLDQVLADARAALEGRAVGQRRDGIEVAANGTVTAWAEADTSEAARAAVLVIADRIEAANGAWLRSAPAGIDAPARTEALRAEAEEAARERDALAREVERLRSADAVPSESDRSDLEAALRADETRAAELRRRIAAWQEAAGDLREGSPAGGELSALAGWSAFRALAEERQRLGERIQEMSRTLLDAHPRMVITRLRLDDVAGELRPLQSRLLGEAEAELGRMEREADELDRTIEGERERLADAAVAGRTLAEAQTALRVAQDVSARLEAALRAGLDANPAPAAAVPSTSAWTRSEVRIEESRMSPWPSAAAGAGIGFLASTLGLLAVGFVGPRRRGSGIGPAEGDAPPAGSVDAPPTLPDERAAAIPGAELASVDDVIDAIVSSGVARTMLVTVGEGGSRPLSVDIVRRLALRGRSTVLVDLSPDQRAARSMGASADHPGLRDLIDGRATFASIARHDFATQADIVPYGSEPADKRLDTPQERRNVLDFIERSYDVLLVDCGRMTPGEITELMDSDAALLVAIGKASAEDSAAAIGRLRDAGLDDLIMVREALPA